ncbi:hypothetical protein Arth_1847 [Arthrobacter sp. FB24]|uniref:hypothetical protein n=1 Tax=Arthrobacter sp. (strain FB24) TaxID=290399 RepID=UPI0000526DC6|nr:hypothetical protein [Arthrobacter sp. FB24]ABK03236.1 hypothetical protein Arth_1847 [Arthrobacter sp. FB24]
MSTRRKERILLTGASVVVTVTALILAVMSSLTEVYSLRSAAPVLSTYYSTLKPAASTPATYDPPNPGDGGEWIDIPPPPPPSFSPVPTRSAISPTGAVSPSQTEQPGLEGCFDGRMAFKAPSPLKQGEKVEFVVRVVFKTSPIDPGSGLPGTGDPTRRDVLLCEKMRADLTSEDGGMNIERSTSETIALPKSHFGEWGWHITGVQPGRHQMVLRLVIPDLEGDTAINSHTETITVDVGLMYVVSAWIKDMSAPMNAFLGSIALVGGWVVVAFTRKTKKGKHAPTTGAH